MASVSKTLLPNIVAGAAIRDGNGKRIDTTYATKTEVSGLLSYITTAPSAANTSGLLKVVVLSSEPATRYDGYLYIITGSAS